MPGTLQYHHPTRSALIARSGPPSGDSPPPVSTVSHPLGNGEAEGNVWEHSAVTVRHTCETAERRRHPAYRKPHASLEQVEQVEQMGTATNCGRAWSHDGLIPGSCLRRLTLLK